MTLLQQQLQQLQMERIETARSGMRKSIPSLIFGNDAKQVTIQEVYEISLTALRQLQAHSEIFKQFEDTIFAPDTLTFDRDVSEPHIVKQIDQTISQYLKTLCGYYNLNSAIQSLEYLVRRFRIDIHHEQELFYTFLPFHDQEGFKLLINGIKPKILQDVTLTFPTSRASLQQFIVQNHFEHLNQILKTLNKLNTQQSRTLYTRFAYTVIIELVSLQVKGSDNLCGIALSQILNDVKTKKSEDSLLYALACAIMVYNYYGYTIDAAFTDKLLFNLIHNQPSLRKQDLFNFVYKIGSYQEKFIPGTKIAMQLLQKQSINDTGLPVERFDYICAYCIDSLFQLNAFRTSQQEQESRLQILQQLIKESAQNQIKLQNTFSSTVRYLLTIYNNNIDLNLNEHVCKLISNTLNMIEEHDGSTFTNGIQKYIKSGGNIQIVQKIVQSKLTALLTTEINIIGQKSSYLHALQNINNNIRYEAYGHLEKLLNTANEQQIDKQTLEQLFDYLFSKLNVETDLQIIKIILSVILSLSKKNIKTQSIGIVQSIFTTIKRVLFTQSYDIYDIFKILREIINGLQINNINIDSAINIITIQLNLEQINMHNPIADELEKLNNVLLKNIETIDFTTLFKISNNDMFHIFTTTQNTLHYKSLLVYYVIYNINKFVDKFDYRLCNELFNNELIKRFFVQQYINKLSMKDQMQFQDILNLKEDVLKLYLEKSINQIDLKSFIQQFVHQFCRMQSSADEQSLQKVQQISINTQQQILVYHEVLLQFLSECKHISEDILIPLMSIVYIYNKNIMYEQLGQIKGIVHQKYVSERNNQNEDNSANSPELKELQLTKKTIDNKLKLDFFNDFKQNYDQQYIQQLDEVLLTINFAYLDPLQTYSIVQQIMQYLYQESSVGNLVKVVIDILMILINDIQQLDASNTQTFNTYTSQFKQYMSEELRNIMIQRKHIDFQCDIMILDHLMLLNNIIFQQLDEQDAYAASNMNQDKQVQLVQVNMYICFTILSSIDLYQIELSNIPYVVWVISYIERFSTVTDNMYLSTIQQCAFFSRMQESAKSYLKNVCLDIENCQQIYETNIEVFLETFLHTKYITNKKLLVKKLVSTLVEITDDIIIFKGLELILKVILNTDLEEYPTLNNQSDVPDEQNTNEQPVLSIEDAQVLTSHILQTYNERMTDRILDILVQFTPYMSFNYLGDNFIPMIFDDRVLSVSHINTLSDTVLARFSHDQCLQLLQILLYHATMSGTKMLNDAQLLQYLHLIIQNIINYIPEFLPGYIIFLLTQFESQENVNTVDLLAMFSSDQQIGTLSVLLGYLFDVGDVMKYLNQDNENYSGLAVLDMFMATNEEIIDLVLQFTVFALQQLETAPLDIETKQSKLTPPSSKSSISKSEVPAVFLYVVALQLPENTQNVAFQVQKLLKTADIFAVSTQHKQQLMENNLFCNNYKIALSEFILQNMEQKLENDQHDQKSENINSFIKNINEQFILHLFNTIPSQYLISVLLKTSSFMHNTNTIEKIQKQLIQLLSEQNIDQENGECVQTAVQNLCVLIDKMGTRYIPHINLTFKLLSSSNKDITAYLTLSHKISLYKALVLFQGRFISTHISQIYEFLLEAHNEQLQTELQELYDYLSQYVQFRSLMQNAVDLYLRQKVTKNNQNMYIKLITATIVPAITHQIKQFNVQLVKQIIQACQEMIYFNDLDIGLQITSQILKQLFQALSRTQLSPNEIQTIINLTENQEFNKFGSIVIQIILNEAMVQIPDLKTTYVNNINKQSELIYDFKRFNKVQDKGDILKNKYNSNTEKNSSTQDSPYKDMQNLIDKTITFGDKQFTRTRALYIQQFIALLNYFKCIFNENLVSHEILVQEVFNIYTNETLKYELQENIIFKRQYSLACFEQVGRQMTDNLLLQQPWVQTLKAMAEIPEFLQEVVSNLEGSLQAQNKPDNIKEILIGVLSEHLEVEKFRETAETCLQLLEKLAKGSE